MNLNKVVRAGAAMKAAATKPSLSAQAQLTNLQAMCERGTATSDQRRQLDLVYQDRARLHWQGRGPAGPHTAHWQSDLPARHVYTLLPEHFLCHSPLPRSYFHRSFCCRLLYAAALSGTCTSPRHAASESCFRTLPQPTAAELLPPQFLLPANRRAQWALHVTSARSSRVP